MERVWRILTRSEEGLKNPTRSGEGLEDLTRSGEGLKTSQKDVKLDKYPIKYTSSAKATNSDTFAT